MVLLRRQVHWASLIDEKPELFIVEFPTQPSLNQGRAGDCAGHGRRTTVTILQTIPVNFRRLLRVKTSHKANLVEVREQSRDCLVLFVKRVGFGESSKGDSRSSLNLSDGPLIILMASENKFFFTDE